MKLSPLHFHLLMPTQKFEEKKDSFEIVFSHTKVVFSSPKSAKKTRIWQFWAFPAAFNHRFIQKIIALLKKRQFFPQKWSLCLFSNHWIYRKFFDNKVGINKISKDIKEGESVLMNVAPLYF